MNHVMRKMEGGSTIDHQKVKSPTGSRGKVSRTIESNGRNPRKILRR